MSEDIIHGNAVNTPYSLIFKIIFNGTKYPRLPPLVNKVMPEEPHVSRNCATVSTIN